MKTAEILELNDTSIFEELECKRIDMYYSGWECDSIAWILEDGRIFGTNHGSVEKISKKDFNKYLNKLSQYVLDVNKTLEKN